MTTTADKYIQNHEPYTTIKVEWFEGYIKPTNRRDTHNKNMESVLLVDLKEVSTEEEFRDHTWIKMNNKVRKAISNIDRKTIKKNGKKKVLVKGEVFVYLSSTGKKAGIRNIKQIKILEED